MLIDTFDNTKNIMSHVLKVKRIKVKASLLKKIHSVLAVGFVELGMQPLYLQLPENLHETYVRTQNISNKWLLKKAGINESSCS